MNRVDVGIQSGGIISCGCPLEGFEMIRRAGFSCCALGLGSYFGGVLLHSARNGEIFELPVGELRDICAPYRKAARAAGVRISEISIPYASFMAKAQGEREGGLRRTIAENSMEICSLLDCPYMVVGGFEADDSRNGKGTGWERTGQLMEFLAPMAQERKITICIDMPAAKESSGKIWEIAAGVDRFNERYNADIFGFCFDTGHANLAGIDIEDYIMALGNRLKVIHVHDNDGIGDWHQIPFMVIGKSGNTASVDWKSVVRGLGKIRFDGVLAFETTPVITAFPKEMRQDVLRFTAQVGDYFAGEILGKDW